MELTVRPAERADAAALARIYSEGIEDRNATFETDPRSAADAERWFDGEVVLIAVEDGCEVVAFAGASPYRPQRRAYDGVREFMVYVARSHRGRGAGRAAMEALLAESERRGHVKLVSRVFPENAASRALLRAVGFREVGVYRRHGKLDGVWKDNVIVERLLGEAAHRAD
jgi:L-amino acid N-acyltransferase YncA